MMPDIPRIETERLILRGPREEDMDAVAAFATSEERTRYIGGPTDRFGAWQSLLAMMGHWALRGYGQWIIEDKDSGEAVGRTGVIRHDGWAEPELGWVMFPGFEGKGLAQEAATAARAYAAREWGFDRLVTQIHPESGRSIALALRLGATEEGEGELLGEPCVLYRHPDPGEADDAA